MNNDSQKNTSENLYTSTPCLKSSQGRKILKQLFLKNFPKDVSLQEESLKESLSETMKGAILFLKEKINMSTPTEYKTPETITPNTRKLLDVNFRKSIKAKLNRRCIRLQKKKIFVLLLLVLLVTFLISTHNLDRMVHLKCDF